MSTKLEFHFVYKDNNFYIILYFFIDLSLNILFYLYYFCKIIKIVLYIYMIFIFVIFVNGKC